MTISAPVLYVAPAAWRRRAGWDGRRQQQNLPGNLWYCLMRLGVGNTAESPLQQSLIGSARDIIQLFVSTRRACVLLWYFVRVSIRFRFQLGEDLPRFVEFRHISILV